MIFYYTEAAKKTVFRGKIAPNKWTKRRNYTWAHGYKKYVGTLDYFVEIFFYNFAQALEYVIQLINV